MERRKEAGMVRHDGKKKLAVQRGGRLSQKVMPRHLVVTAYRSLRTAISYLPRQPQARPQGGISRQPRKAAGARSNGSSTMSDWV